MVVGIMRDGESGSNLRTAERAAFDGASMRRSSSTQMETKAEAKAGLMSSDRRTSSTRLNSSDWSHFRNAKEDSQDEGMKIACSGDLPRSQSLPVSSTGSKIRSSFSFRRFASSDFWSGTLSVASASSKDQSGESTMSMTSGPGRMKKIAARLGFSTSV